MKKLLGMLLLVVTTSAMAQRNVYKISVENNRGKLETLKKYKGKVLLIVNTATRCGFTPQYKELQALYEQYETQGLVILDFPCNQFGQQAPGSIEEIQQFCTANFETTFPLYNKVEVNGANEAPLFTYLKKKKTFLGFGNDQRAQMMDQMLKRSDPDYASNSDIKWNFTKFLVNRKGKVIARFEPTTSMQEVKKAIEREL